MPDFSVFQDFGCGGFEFSSEPTHAEKIYNAQVAAKIRAFDMSDGSAEEADTYAQAMGLGAARYTLERARNQLDPLKAVELLPRLEDDWQIVPGELDDILTRQRTVAAAQALLRGARREALEDGLRSLLGSDFIALRRVKPTEANNYTSIANFQTRPDLPFKLIKLTSPVGQVGTPYTVDYATADADVSAPVLLEPGDALMVQPNSTARREVVTVQAATATTFSAVFTHGHDEGVYATTQNWPGWLSTQRYLFVIVSHAVAVDPEMRRRINRYMARAVRGVTNWAIVEPTTPGADTIGPFTLDSSPLGAVPIGQISIPESRPAPSITTVSPSSGTALGGIVVAIDGAFFYSPITVTFNGIPATITLHTLTHIEVLLPNSGGLFGVVPLTISNPNGSVSAPFTYV